MMFPKVSTMKNPLLLAVFTACLLASVRGQDQPAAPAAPDVQRAYFAGGCFWCMQYAFDKVPGVSKTVVGYTGGKVATPDYDEVSTGSTGHAESIEVQYDPAKVTYMQLLDVFWKNIDPTQANRQFADKGTQYRTAVFYRDDAEKQAAEASKDALEKSGKYNGKPIVTEITKAGSFYPAEEYHQEYYRKNPEHFQRYEVGSGRAGYVKKMWGVE